MTISEDFYASYKEAQKKLGAEKFPIEQGIIKKIHAPIEEVSKKYEQQRKGLMCSVLDKGYVRMAPHWVMGLGDLDISNDARVSFMSESLILNEKDKKLIKFLGSHKHTSCFRGVSVKMEVSAPLMFARQWWKYIIGSQHIEELQSDEYAKYQDHFSNWNESSRRYIRDKLEFHIPQRLYSSPENRKQGSGEQLSLEQSKEIRLALDLHYEQCAERYFKAIESGLCVEQARLFLPAYGLYVKWVWTCSLQTLCHFISQRINAGSQKGIQEYAKAVYILTRHLFEHGMEELLSPEAKELLKR